MAAVAIALGLAWHAAQAECVLEDGEISVIGTSACETFPGPPNYESIADGDEPETHWSQGFYPATDFQARRRLQKRTTEHSVNATIVRFDQPDSDAYTREYYFTKTRGCWQLTKVDDQSL